MLNVETAAPGHTQQGYWSGRVYRHRSFQLVAIVAFCVVIWTLRRPEQLFRPYVWDEESYILKYYVAKDWFGVLKPLEGYLTLPTNVLVALAAATSFVHVPIVMYVFALLMFVATILIIVVPDSRWGNWNTRAAMAIGAALVPANPEVFGVLLYCFWWSTLWPIAILGWKRTLWPLRAPLLAIAAFSSPAAGALFVLFGLSFLRRREPRDLIGATILFAGFVPQTILTLTSARAAMVLQARIAAVLEQSLRTAGLFESTWLSTYYWAPNLLSVLGFMFLLFLTLASIVVSMRSRSDEALLLTLAALVFTLLSAIPVPLITNPATAAGPRYYFLPFVAYGWVLLYLWRTSYHRHLRTVCATLFFLSFLNLVVTFSRTPDTRTARLSWHDELKKCAQSADSIVHVPIYFVGSSLMWPPLELRPAQCRRFTR